MRNAFALFLLLLPASAFAQPQKTADAIAALAQKQFEADQFSGVVLVAHGSDVLLERAWGLADREANVPNTIETRFNIGSINKAFTQTAIAQLAAAGKLSTSDTVRKYLPDYPSPVADRITIEQLLDHRSGLGDFFGPKYAAAPPSSLRELKDFLPLFASEPLQFEPGTSQEYSNAGYIVLGLIIERVSGEKYRDYIQEHVFAPAGMKDSGFPAVDDPVAKRATGYTMRGPDGPLPARRPNTNTLPGRPSSAGGAYATAHDLFRFAQWKKANGIGIAGGAPGLNAVLEADNGWTVVVMSNYDPPSAMSLGRAAMDIARGVVAVDLKPAGHLMSVEATVNGKGPYRFVIDSGAAGRLRVSLELAKELALEQVGEAATGDPSGKNTQTRPVVRVASIDVGALHFADVDATVSAGGGAAQADGVIGLGLFGDRTVAIDFPKQELRVSSKPIPDGAPHVVPFTMRNGVPAIDVDLAGVTVRADVDTGSPALLNVPPSVALPFTGEPVVAGHGRTSTNEFDIKRATLKGDLHVAGYTVANPELDLVDLFPIANIGARFLREYIVAFDLVNHRIWLGKEQNIGAQKPR